jgi:hypothetical protein
MSLVGKEGLSSTEFVSGDLEGYFSGVTVGLPLGVVLGGFRQRSLVTESSAKSHVSHVEFEIVVVNDVVVRAIDRVTAVFTFGLSLLVEIEHSGLNHLALIRSDLASRVEGVGTGFERVRLAFLRIDRRGFLGSRVDSWNPELLDHHSTDSQSTSLVGADVFDSGKCLDGVHSSHQGVSLRKVGGSSSKGERDDGYQTRWEDRDGGSDSVGCDREWDVTEAGGSDHDKCDDHGGAEEEVGQLVEPKGQRRSQQNSLT